MAAKKLCETHLQKNQSHLQILQKLKGSNKTHLQLKSSKQDGNNKANSLNKIPGNTTSSNQQETSTLNLNALVDTSFCFQKPGQDDQKRNKIYDNESFKQDGQESTETTMQSNSQVFEEVFVQNPKFKQSFSTAASFPKCLSVQKQSKNQMNIQHFSLGKKLGSGKFGQVFIARQNKYNYLRHKVTGFMCAIKRIDKSNIDKKLIIQLIREIKIQSYLNNPNIVKLYNFFADQKYVYLVMELCFSGQLYGLLRKKKKLEEDLTKAILKDTLKALDYMHERQIIHRDLKPENIIFHNGMIKLCDFGWSISSKTMRETFCGTPLYVSPQLLKRKNYNNKIDVWSIGILTYQLLFGRVPFEISSEKDFIKIVQDQIKFSKTTPISSDAKQFILICLKKDPRDRYTVAQLLEHPFITSVEPIKNTQMC